MNSPSYTPIFYGNFILVSRIQNELNDVGIVPIIKDEGESQRLAGYASLNQGYQEIYVSTDQLDKAMIVLNRIKNDVDIH